MPVAASNTSSFSVNTNKSEPQKEVAPLVIPNSTKWNEPTAVVTAKPDSLPKGGGQRAVVTYVGDGDGASLKTKEGKDIACRVDLIDAPETAKPKLGKKGQAFSEESKQILQQMILNKEVNVTVTQAPSEKNFNRSLCRIEVEGTDVGLEMVKQGAAWLYRKYGNPTEYDKASTNAQVNRNGLFKDPNAIHPREFKHPK